MELSILNLLFVLLVVWLAGMVTNRLGYPSVLGELMAGIILGPPLLGLLAGGEALQVLAEVGILLMMFYIGMEIDPRELGRASKAGLLAAAGGFITPFVLCYGLIVWAGGTPMAALFVGIAAGVTSLATKSRVLLDLKLFDTRVAHVMMAGALVTDTVSLIIFAGVIGVAEAGSLDLMGLLGLALRAVLFFGAAAWLGLKVLPHLGRRLQQMRAVGRTGSFTLVLLITLGFAEMAELAGLHGILGAFFAGLCLRESALGWRRSKEIMDLVHQTSIGFLAPIFFVTAGFAVSLDVFTEHLGLLSLLVVLATVGKIVGTTLFYLPTGYGWREGVTVGLGMNGRGAVEIILAQIAMNMGLITQEIFSILVFMAILTTALEPVMLKWGIGWLRRRGELVRAHEKRQGTLIIGAGPTARALGRILSRTQPVWLVDRNADLCARARADGLQVVQGSALEENVLMEAHALDVLTCVAMTPNAEVNALAAQCARTLFGVPQVHVLNTGDAAGHAELRQHVQATTLFAGPVALGTWDYRVDHDEVTREGLPVASGQAPAELFAALQQPQHSLPVALRRGEVYLPFHSESELQPGDRVIVLRPAREVPAAFDRFDRLVAHGPVLDLDGARPAEAFFAEAADQLAPRLGLPAERLAAKLASREATTSTVLLPGLAIPHVTVAGHGRFELLIARCREGVVFPGQPERVHAAFVLVGTEDERNFHLRALSAIAQIVQNPAFERDWLLAVDAERLRQIVLQGTRRRLPEAARAAAEEPT